MFIGGPVSVGVEKGIGGSGLFGLRNLDLKKIRVMRTTILHLLRGRIRPRPQPVFGAWYQKEVSDGKVSLFRSNTKLEEPATSSR